MGREEEQGRLGKWFELGCVLDMWNMRNDFRYVLTCHR